MARLAIFAIVLALASVNCSSPGFEVSIKSVNSISDYLKENPELSALPMLKEVETINQNTRFVYKFGNRVRGDRQLANDSGNQQWGSPQNYKLTLRYPNQGEGAIISHLEVVLDQSSDLGDGTVVVGGIGQRRIEIVIEARNTLYARYRATIFGY